MKTKNRGFTLVELIVAMAVVALIGTLVLSFLTVSTNTYGKVTQETNMQEDAQIVLAQLYNYVVDTDASLRYFVDTAEAGAGTEVLCDDQYTGGAADFAVKRLEIYKYAETGMTLETISWKKSSANLTYKREKIDNAGNKTSDVIEQVLATDVTSFSSDLTDVESKSQMKVKVGLTMTAKEYTAENTVNLRNKIQANTFPEENTSGTAVSSVMGVKVVPQTVEVEKNDRKTFQAVVNGSNNPSQKVTWRVEGATSILTVIDSAGKLWVGSDEKSKQLTVCATSVQDSAKSGTGAVTVTTPKKGPDKLTLGTIRDYYTYTHLSLFLYARVNGELTGDITWKMEHIDQAGGSSLSEISAFDAAKFTAGSVGGTCKITISAMVDGEYYTDYVYVHIQEATSWMKPYISFNDTSEYWVQAGDEITVSTTLGASYTIAGKTRTWSSTTSSGVYCTINTSGTDKETATIRVTEDSINGEIRIRALVGNQYMSYYDEITIHVYVPFDFDYVMETTNLKQGDNSYDYRLVCRGPVRFVTSSSELTNLSEGILQLFGTNYTTLSKASYYSYTGYDAIKEKDKWYVNSSGACSIGSDAPIELPKMIVSEQDLTISAGEVYTASDSIIYIKGNHTLKIHWGSIYFSGIIYAPEGTVEIEVEEGFVCGTIIAKEVKLIHRGDGAFSVMEKQSVMEQIHELKSN